MKMEVYLYYGDLKSVAWTLLSH